MSQPILSVVTSTRNRQASVARLGQLLMASVKWEWLVADAGDEPMAFLAGATLTRSWPPQGATLSLRKLFPQCRGEYVALLQDDLQPEPEAVDKAVEFMRQNPTVGQGVFYTRTPFHRCHVPPWHGWLYGPYWIARREAGEQVDWYSPEFLHAGADNDFSAKILSAGWGVVAIPGACLREDRVNDATHEQAMQRSEQARDGQRAEEKWKPKQQELLSVWEQRWKKLSGPMECGRPH